MARVKVVFGIGFERWLITLQGEDIIGFAGDDFVGDLGLTAMASRRTWSIGCAIRRPSFAAYCTRIRTLLTSISSPSARTFSCVSVVSPWLTRPAIMATLKLCAESTTA